MYTHMLVPTAGMTSHQNRFSSQAARARKLLSGSIAAPDAQADSFEDARRWIKPPVCSTPGRIRLLS